MIENLGLNFFFFLLRLWPQMLPSSATRTSAKLGQGSQSPAYSFVSWALGNQNRGGQGACDSPAPGISALNTFWSPMPRWHGMTPWGRSLCVSSIYPEGFCRDSGVGFFSLRRGRTNPLVWTHRLGFFFKQRGQVSTSGVDSSLPSVLVPCFMKGGIAFHGCWFLYGPQRQPVQPAKCCQSALRCLN